MSIRDEGDNRMTSRQNTTGDGHGSQPLLVQRGPLIHAFGMLRPLPIATVKPAIVILEAGGARLDIGRPILMTPDEDALRRVGIWSGCGHPYGGAQSLPDDTALHS